MLKLSKKLSWMCLKIAGRKTAFAFGISATKQFPNLFGLAFLSALLPLRSSAYPRATQSNSSSNTDIDLYMDIRHFTAPPRSS